MRILKISDVFFPRVNGVSTSIDTFRRDLAALGHEVVLVAPSYSGTSADPRETASAVASKYCLPGFRPSASRRAMETHFAAVTA